MITAVLLFIWQTIKDFGAILRDSPVARYITLAVLVTILVGSFFLFRGCKSPTEKRIESRDPVIVEQEQAANDAVNKAIEANTNANVAEIEANKAQENVNKVKRDKRANVRLDEANRNRCLAFPESSECK